MDPECRSLQNPFLPAVIMGDYKILDALLGTITAKLLARKWLSHCIRHALASASGSGYKILEYAVSGGIAAPMLATTDMSQNWRDLETCALILRK